MKAIYQLQELGLIDLFFADETGFSLRPNVPYGWQKIGQQVTITTQRQHVQNTFGLLNVKSKALYSFSTDKSIDSNFICDSIDFFAAKIQKPTVIVLDNAPWHTSRKFLSHVNQWNDNNLYIFHLPKYSPHLNLIETLWRLIKYKWLRPIDFNSKTALKKKLKLIFSEFGNLFDANFSMNFFESI